LPPVCSPCFLKILRSHLLSPNPSLLFSVLHLS
jgi:hypothetical protein